MPYEKKSRDIFPIRTYQQLVDVTQTKQPNFLDPLAGLMETLAKLKIGEQVWIQIIFRPADDKWAEKSQKFAEKFADKLLGKEKKASKGVIGTEIKTWIDAFSGVASEIITNQPATFEKKEEKEKLTRLVLLPAERDMLEGIAEKASKKGYETKIQFVYAGRREGWNPANISAVMGFVNQFANLNMNLLKPDDRSITKANYAFAKLRKAYRQRKLMRMMRLRTYWERGYILNIEELATLYHFPTVAVQAPVTPYIESKKAGAPMDLPME